MAVRQRKHKCGEISAVTTMGAEMQSMVRKEQQNMAHIRSRIAPTATGQPPMTELMHAARARVPASTSL